MEFNLGVVTVIERGSAHDGTVLLLNKRVVVRVVGPGAGHANVVGIAPRSDCLVEEFRPIVGVNMIDGVREFVLDFFHRRDHPFSGFVLDRPVDRPPGNGISDGQCERVLTLGTVATMSDGIDCDHAGLPVNGRDPGRDRYDLGVLIPPRPSRGFPVRIHREFERCQQSVDRGRTHRQQLRVDLGAVARADPPERAGTHVRFHVGQRRPHDRGQVFPAGLAPVV